MFGGSSDNSAMPGATVGQPMPDPTPSATDSPTNNLGMGMTMPAPTTPDDPSMMASAMPSADGQPDQSQPMPAAPAAQPLDDHPMAPVSDDLLEIKQHALQQLSPLVGHLDQTPEEKFRTTMMMIQASDNQDLVKEAYEAANAIEDEKTRAQALLDVINEINYFTQHHDEQ